MAPTSGYTDFLGLYIVILDRFPVDLDKFDGDRRFHPSSSYPSAIWDKELLEDQTDRVRFYTFSFHSPVPRDC